MSRITFKSVVNDFISFFNSHLAVNQVLFITEFDEQTRENVYPAVLIVPQPSNVVNTELDLMFNIFVVDLLNEPRTNRKEVFSSTLSICQDFIAYFNDNDNFDYTLDNNITLQPVDEKFVDDIICGWGITCSVQLPFSKGICDIPLGTTQPIYNYNILLVGTPSLSADGILSGFSHDDYGKIPNLFPPITEGGFKAYFKFNTGSMSEDVSIMANEYDHTKAIRIDLNSNGYLSYYLSDNGSTWNVCNSVSGVQILSPNTDYVLKFDYDGGAYDSEIALYDDETPIVQLPYMQDLALTLGGQLPLKYLCFGNRWTQEMSTDFDGSWDIAKSFVLTPGGYWWQGLSD